MMWSNESQHFFLTPEANTKSPLTPLMKGGTVEQVILKQLQTYLLTTKKLHPEKVKQLTRELGPTIHIDFDETLVKYDEEQGGENYYWDTFLLELVKSNLKNPVEVIKKFEMASDLGNLATVENDFIKKHQLLYKSDKVFFSLMEGLSSDEIKHLLESTAKNIKLNTEYLKEAFEQMKEGGKLVKGKPNYVLINTNNLSPLVNIFLEQNQGWKDFQQKYKNEGYDLRIIGTIGNRIGFKNGEVAGIYWNNAGHWSTKFRFMNPIDNYVDFGFIFRSKN